MVSHWGDAFNTVAPALLVYLLTGSGMGVSGVVVAESSRCWSLPRSLCRSYQTPNEVEDAWIGRNTAA